MSRGVRQKQITLAQRGTLNALPGPGRGSLREEDFVEEVAFEQVYEGGRGLARERI